MPDTIRTKSALLALAPNNTTGDIGAQDLRDMIVSFYTRLDDSVAIKTDPTTTFSTPTDVFTVIQAKASSGNMGVFQAIDNTNLGLTIRGADFASQIDSDGPLTIKTNNTTTSVHINITAANVSSGSSSSNINLSSGSVTGFVDNLDGGSINLTAGSASSNNSDSGYGRGGHINLTAGSAAGSQAGFAGAGGDITITGGVGATGEDSSNGSNGGAITISGGNCDTNYTGGILLLKGGSNTSAAEGASISLGGGSSTPGQVTITTGYSSLGVGEYGIVVSGNLCVSGFTASSSIYGLIDSFPIYNTSGEFIGYVPVYTGLSS